jgi:Ca-activated chloride channel family protein
MVSSQGTAINEALKLAKTFFDDDTQTNRFLFIISDGEDHEENSGRIAKDILNEGIKTYTVGVGSNKGVPIPIKRKGKFIGYKKDNKDEVVITKLHPETLKEIAENGDGKYILGNNTTKSIDFIEDLLMKADKKEFETKQFSDYKDQFQWFIGLGLLFLVLDVFLLNKKTKWVQKMNLFNEK